MSYVPVIPGYHIRYPVRDWFEIGKEYLGMTQGGTPVNLFVTSQRAGRDTRILEALERVGGSLSESSVKGYCRVLDCGRTTDRAYLIVERFEGQTIEQLIQQYKFLDVGFALRVQIEINRSLLRSHEHELFCAELTTEQVRVAADGSVKLDALEFGLFPRTYGQSGWAADDGTNSDLPMHLSPEMLEDAGAHRQSLHAAVWGAGVIFYRMLTGQYPFKAKTMRDLCLALEHEEPRDMSVLRSDIPKAVKNMSTGALARDYEDRISMEKFLKRAKLCFHILGRRF